MHSWCTPSAIAWEFYWRLVLVHFDVENMKFCCPHATAPGGHQDGTRSAPGLHQECTRSTKGVHQECARSAPGALWRIFSTETDKLTHLKNPENSKNQASPNKPIAIFKEQFIQPKDDLIDILAKKSPLFLNTDSDVAKLPPKSILKQEKSLSELPKQQKTPNKKRSFTLYTACKLYGSCLSYKNITL